MSKFPLLETITGPADIKKMSIEELEEYIDELKEEIARVEGNIEVKKKHRDGVESIFKN